MDRMAAATIVKHRRDNAPVVVDVGGGYGGAVTLRLKDNGIPHIGFNGASASSKHTKDSQLKFANKRAEAWWKFREELDPDQQGGSVIACRLILSFGPTLRRRPMKSRRAAS
jgi:hypothetical protein